MSGGLIPAPPNMAAIAAAAMLSCPGGIPGNPGGGSPKGGGSPRGGMFGTDTGGRVGAGTSGNMRPTCNKTCRSVLNTDTYEEEGEACW